MHEYGGNHIYASARRIFGLGQHTDRLSFSQLVQFATLTWTCSNVAVILLTVTIFPKEVIQMSSEILSISNQPLGLNQIMEEIL